MQNFASKTPLEKVSLSFPFSLNTGETITGAVVTPTVLRGTDASPSTLLSGSRTISGAIVSQFVEGGIDGATYFISVQATTSTGRILVSEGVLPVVNNNQTSSLFIKAIDVYAVKNNQLAMASATYGKLANVSDDTIWTKLVAAENDLSRRLGIPLSPLEIFHTQPTQPEIDALNGARYLVEPGYDMVPAFFSVGKCGYFTLRQTPVIDIHEIKFIYPNLGGQAFTVPSEWIKLDHKYGHVHLFPSAQTASAPLAMVVTLQAISAGVIVPHMIRVRYTAGLSNTSTLYPDVIDLVKRMAVLRMIHDAFVPQSESISADGLSQSKSVDIAKMQEGIESQIAYLKLSLVGMVWDVM